MDENVEQQVWQRVRGQRPQEQTGMDLRNLTLRAMEAAAEYRYLSGVLSGPSRDQARRLWERQQEIVSCLLGIARLSGSPGEKEKILEIPKEPPEKVLVRAYHRARKMVTEYTARGLDPQAGLVYRSLADREQEQCTAIARLLGRMQSGKNAEWNSKKTLDKGGKP